MSHQSIIYLIYSELGIIGQWKIGFTTRRAKDRIREMKTSNPNIVGVSAEYKVYSEFGRDIETVLKRYLRMSIIEGEWILFEALTINKFLELCSKIETNFKIIKNTSTL